MIIYRIVCENALGSQGLLGNQGQQSFDENEAINIAQSWWNDTGNHAVVFDNQNNRIWDTRINRPVERRFNNAR